MPTDAADLAVPLDLRLVRTGTGGPPETMSATLTVTQSRMPLRITSYNVCYTKLLR